VGFDPVSPVWTAAMLPHLKKKNKDHKKVPKQDEDTGNFQILFHLWSLFLLHGIIFTIIPCVILKLDSSQNRL